MSKVHEDNAGYVGVSYEETQDPFYSYNKLSLPLAESDKTVVRDEVTVAVTITTINSANKYVLDGTVQATVSLLAGNIYTFDQSHSSNIGHPLRFSYTADGTHGGGQEYTLGVTTNGTPGQSGAYTKIVVPFGLHNLKYYCSQHPSMGGSANVVENTKAFTVGRPILKTTDAFGKTLGSGNNADPYAANLVLAIPMNGANNGTTFTDVSATIRGSGSAKTVTRTNAVTKTDKSYLYGSSGYYDANSSRLQVTNSSDFDFGDGDYTIEVWVHPTDTGTRNIVSRSYTGGTGNYSGFILSTAGFLETVGQTAWDVNISHTLPINVWSHCAVVRKANTWTYFVNGVSVGSASARGSVPTGPGDLYVSYRDGQTDFFGYMQDLRIYKGVAKYPIPFTLASYGMDIATWSGNGSSQQIRSLNFKPDLVWIKNINGGHNHMLYDAIRGAGNELITNGTQQQNQGGSSDLTSFEEGGFNLGSNNAVNQSGRNYLAWCWKAKGTGSSVSAGALTTSAYNKDQTWSTYGSFTGATWNPAIGTLFNGNPSNGPSLLAGNTGTWTFTQPITASSSIKINCVNGSGPLGSTITSGTEIRLTVDGVTHAISGRPGLIDTGLTGNLEGITIHVTSGSGSPGLRYILVDGKELLDDGVSSPTIPTQNATVSASEEFGFSVVQYAGSSSAISVAHGLPSAPDFMLVKKYNASGDQFVAFHVDVGNEHALRLNDAPADSGYDWWGSVSPNDKVFTVGTTGATNSSSGQYIAYCWCNRPGYSKFGRFTGLCSSSYTQELGFKPKFVMIRRVFKGSGNETTYGGWGMYQEPFTAQQLMANCSGEEGVRGNCAVGSSKRDIQANVVFNDTSFTVSSCWFEQNDTVDYIYAAWAESAPGDPAFISEVVDQVGKDDLSGNNNKASNAGALWQTSLSKFYGGATNFDGSNGSLTVPGSADLAMGTGNFTYEMWIYQNNYTNRSTFFDNRTTNSTTGITVGTEASTGQIRVYMNASSGGDIAVTGTTMPLNQWVHIAVCRNNGVVTLFVNGTPSGSGTRTSDLNNPTHLISFGQTSRPSTSSYSYLNGYMQDIRIYKGIAKYSSSFSPPERSVQGTARRYPSGIYVLS